MKRIWAPWRMKFVQSQADGCIFCEVQKETDGPGNLIVHRGRAAFVILNRYPYTSGHLLVVANLHRPSLEDIEAETRAEMMELATRGIRALRLAYRPDAFNVGANIGEAAGAGVPGHVHLHVVPRWTGDSSFMSTVGGTRVLPEELTETYPRLLEAWQKV